jgi:hypothetical protein
MAIIVKNKSGGNFQQVPPGTYLARCYSVIDLGTYETTFQGKTRDRRELRLTWEIPDEVIQTDGGPMPSSISKTYTHSLNEKAALRHDLAAWRGRDFSEQELEGFDVSKLLGQPCMLTVSERKGEDGNIRSYVASVGKLGKGMTCPPAINRSLEYSVEMGKNAVWQSLPEWLQKKLQTCHEFNTQPNDVAKPADTAPSDETEQDVPF